MPKTERRKAAEEMKVRAANLVETLLTSRLRGKWRAMDFASKVAAFAAKEVERRNKEIYEDPGNQLFGVSLIYLRRLIATFETNSAYGIQEFAERVKTGATDSALLEAAGLVCHLCRQRLTPVQLDGKWFHENPPMKCNASPIHERRAQKGNG